MHILLPTESCHVTFLHPFNFRLNALKLKQVELLCSAWVSDSTKQSRIVSLNRWRSILQGPHVLKIIQEHDGRRSRRIHKAVMDRDIAMCKSQLIQLMDTGSDMLDSRLFRNNSSLNAVLELGANARDHHITGIPNYPMFHVEAFGSIDCL